MGFEGGCRQPPGHRRWCRQVTLVLEIQGDTATTTTTAVDSSVATQTFTLTILDKAVDEDPDVLRITNAGEEFDDFQVILTSNSGFINFVTSEIILTLIDAAEIELVFDQR